MSDHEQLTRELRNRADRIAGHALELDEVKSRARVIQRRRRVAGGAAAAVVVAVAAPLAFTALGQRDSAGPPAIANSGSPDPSVTPSPTPAPTEGPSGFRQVKLTADVEAHSGEATIPVYVGGAINLPTGEVLPVETKLTDFAQVGSHWIGIGIQDGTAFVYFLGPDGSTQGQVESGSYSLAASADGQSVAYSTAADRLFVWDGDSAPRELATGGASSVDPVVVKSCSQVSSCTVLWRANADTDTTKAMRSTTDTAEEIPGLISVTDATSDGRVSGLVSLADAGSCSAVIGLYGAVEWQTCDYTIDSFSPDGRYVLATPAYLDGLGYGVATVLDAATGDPVVEYRTAGRQGSFLSDTVWESDDQLLALLYDDGWALMRLGVDGHFANVSTGRIAGEAESAPVGFPAR